MPIRFATSTLPLKPRLPHWGWLGYAQAAVVLLILLPSLFVFDQLINSWLGYAWPGGETSARIMLVLFALSGLFSLPFLLRMRLSPLARLCSMGAGLLFWIILLIATLVQNATVFTIGTTALHIQIDAAAVFRPTIAAFLGGLLSQSIVIYILGGSLSITEPIKKPTKRLSKKR